MVRELALASGLEFDERGTYELKGVPGAWALHALRGTDAATRTTVAPPSENMTIGDRAIVTLARRAPRVMRALTRATRRHSATA